MTNLTCYYMPTFAQNNAIDNYNSNFFPLSSVNMPSLVIYIYIYII